jgi:gliding motility-associated-like protein
VEINFVKLPVADAGKDATVCGNDIDLKAKGTKGYWNLIDGVNYTDRNSTATHARFTGSGLLNFVWTEITDKCLSRDTVNITFIPNPIAEIKPGEAQKCFGSPVTLIRPENPGCRYDWDLDGGKVTSSSDNKVTVYWKYGAEHTVTLTASNERNCKSVSRFTVKQPVPPEASFTHSALDESAPVLVYFINRSATGNDTGKPGYLWKFGDKQTSNEDNPEHLYVHNGNYKITLIVTDSKGCSDSASTVLNISGNNKSRMKIFSPNGDGVNDIFRTGPTDLSNFKCVILNGNGEKIFEWNNPGDGWDGTLNHHGNPASEGLYYFVITGTDESGKSVELGGTVYLLRN